LLQLLAKLDDCLPGFLLQRALREDIEVGLLHRCAERDQSVFCLPAPVAPLSLQGLSLSRLAICLISPPSPINACIKGGMGCAIKVFFRVRLRISPVARSTSSSSP
jgi:hypothetical protein